MRAFLHRLAHWLEWQRGFVVSRYTRDGKLWVGFRCGTCQQVDGVHEAQRTDEKALPPFPGDAPPALFEWS